MNLAAEVNRALEQHRNRVACSCGAGMPGRMDCLHCCLLHAQHIVAAFANEQERWAIERAELQEALNDALADMQRVEHELVEERRNFKTLKEATDRSFDLLIKKGDNE